MDLSTPIFLFLSQLFYVHEYSFTFFPHPGSACICMTDASTTPTQAEPDTILSSLHVLFHLIFTLTL